MQRSIMQRSVPGRRRAWLCGSSALVGVVLGAGAPAMAQTAPSATPATAEVVVTGSRISRKDYVADSPIVTVGQTQLQQTGSVTVETLLNQMPQFVPGSTATSNNPPNGGQAQVELRGLGIPRTLVLLDGRRAQPSNGDNSVDLNTLPEALIDSIEVITGGASATYGSDAIAGVINFKLKHHFRGLEIDAQYGKTDRDDGETQSYHATMGGDFADSKGNAVLSFGYAKRDAVFNGSRAFSAISGPSGTTPYGALDPLAANPFSQAALNAVFARYGVAPGVVTPTTRIGFNNDGTVFGQIPGGPNYRGNTTSPDFSTIKTLGTYNTGAVNYLQIPLNRYNAFGRVEYELNAHIHAYGQFNFTHYNSPTQLAPSPAFGNPAAGNTGFYVPYNNPFISADLATLLASRTNPTGDFLIRDRFTAVGPRVQNNQFDVYQYVLGLNGDIPNTDLTWDIYGTYGHDTQIITDAGNISRANVNQLLRAADGGRSVCAGGFNPFGLNPVSAACASFLSPQTHDVTSVEQREVDATLQGGLFDLPAGRLKFAAGADYRRNSFNFSPDASIGAPNIADGGPALAGFNATPATGGATDVYELFGELFVPVLANLPFVKSLDLDLGYRYSDYGAGASAVGGVSTYKASADWNVAYGFRLRGGYERAIRAPSVAELFLPASQNFPAIGTAGVNSGDPCDIRTSYRTGANAAQVLSLCLAQGLPRSLQNTFTENNTQSNGINSGNPNLQQETADTYSIGAVWAPRFENALFRHISLSVDYFNIKIANAISILPASTTLQKCFNADGSNPTYSLTNTYCTLIQRDPATGELASIQQPLFNIGAFKTSGVDIQADWSFGLGAVGLEDRYGSLAFNFVGTYADSFKIQQLPGSPFQDYVGTIGNNTVDLFAVAHPKWKSMASLTWRVGPVDLTGRWQFIDSMKDATTVTGAAGAVGVPKVNYFDLLGRWRINDTLELRAGVNNITDKQPPFYTSSANQQANTDPGTYDVLGRRYYVGLKARF